MKNKAIKLITTLLLSVMTLNYIGTTVFAVKYTDEMGELGISSSVEIAESIKVKAKTTNIEQTVPVQKDGVIEYVVVWEGTKQVEYYVQNGELGDEVQRDENGKRKLPSGQVQKQNDGSNSMSEAKKQAEEKTNSSSSTSSSSTAGSSTASSSTAGSSTAGSSSSSGSNGPTAKTAEAKQELSYLDEMSKSFSENGLGTIADGIVGLATITLRVQAILIGFAAQSLATLAGTSAGSLDADKVMVISPDQILFNRLAITDINFFQTDSFGTGNKKALASNSPVKAIRENIAKWYYALRTIALIILLVILIYIGIRMAMSTVASEKAVYKQWLWNWLVSMALVFVLHFFILIVINVNNAFVDMLYEGVKQNTALNSSGRIYYG